MIRSRASLPIFHGTGNHTITTTGNFSRTLPGKGRERAGVEVPLAAAPHPERAAGLLEDGAQLVRGSCHHVVILVVHNLPPGTGEPPEERRCTPRVELFRKSSTQTLEATESAAVLHSLQLHAQTEPIRTLQ